MRGQLEIVEWLGIELAGGWSYFVQRDCVFRTWTKSTFPPNAHGVILPFVRGRALVGKLYRLEIGVVAELVAYCKFPREPGYYYCLTEEGNVARLQATSAFSMFDGG